VRFTYRVAGVAIHDGAVLLHRSEHEDFWTLPGGRCELLERSDDALCREMAEELGADVMVQRLLWIVENFFEYDAAHCHEMGLYFLMRFNGEPPGSGGEPFIGHEGDPPLIFQWFPLETLGDMTIYPTFLKERLQAIPDATSHVIHRDRK
jgi:ADP-ribose pyrophosphatase YjhB (NUDIX family)